MAGASTCPPLRDVPEWCTAFGGNIITAFNLYGIGKTCLPLTPEEVTADIDCRNAATLTDPAAIAQAAVNKAKGQKDWDALEPAARCLAMSPKLYTVFGTTACDVQDSLSGAGIPGWMVWGFAAVMVVMVVKK